MKWADVLQDKSLQDLPYKIETNQYGQIVMSPASNQHARMQMRLALIMAAMRTDGEPIAECSIETSDGVKVPDVAWMSRAFLALNRDQVVYPTAPEICVEMISPSNSAGEIRRKTALYFEQGAGEVWTCDLTGAVRFFAADGEKSQSTLFPKYPAQIDVE